MHQSSSTTPERPPTAPNHRSAAKTGVPGGASLGSDALPIPPHILDRLANQADALSRRPTRTTHPEPPSPKGNQKTDAIPRMAPIRFTATVGKQTEHPRPTTAKPPNAARTYRRTTPNKSQAQEQPQTRHRNQETRMINQRRMKVMSTSRTATNSQPPPRMDDTTHHRTGRIGAKLFNV